MKPNDTLTILFRHNLWANLHILEHYAALNDTQLDATLDGTFGSIRATMQHIVTSEQSYFTRISTGQPLRRPENAAPLTLAQMQESLQRTGTGLIEWAPKVQGDDMVEIDWDGTIYAVPKAIVLTQAINHATEHRTQIMAILTQLGIEPPHVDGWSYFDEVYIAGAA